MPSFFAPVFFVLNESYWFFGVGQWAKKRRPTGRLSWNIRIALLIADALDVEKSRLIHREFDTAMFFQRIFNQ